MNCYKTCRQLRTGMSMLEMLAVVVLIGIIAVIVIPRFSNHSVDAKRSACHVNKGNIEVQCQLWYRQKAAIPAANLSDVGADVNFFPDGLPKCPVDGSSYSIDTSTMRVTGHAH